MLFVGRVGIGVEKTYNDRFHLFRDQVLCGREKLILIERRDDLSLGGYPLGDFEPLIAGDERAIVPRKAIEMRTVAASKLQDVAEPFGSNQAALAAVSLENGVRRDRGSMNDKLKISGVDRERYQTFEEALGGISWS